MKINHLLPTALIQSKQWLSIIQDCVYPPTCLLCGDEGVSHSDLCQPCKTALPYFQGGCSLCSALMPNAIEITAVCGECQIKPPDFNHTHVSFAYQEPVRHLIHGLKFNSRFVNARLLATLMAEQLRTVTDKPDLLIPVPLHPQRYRERGFNQSIELTRHLSQQLQIPNNLNSCHRTRNNIPQAALGAKQRRRNLHRTFSVQPLTEVQSIAIIDDVMTTGSTVRAIAKAFKHSGVNKIQVWVCARA
ncbi:MAG TPA: ComF family protein [Crenotrichaceae bacterium]|nr:ComF family protein [Crenotrichaceae bacterium]